MGEKSPIYILRTKISKDLVSFPTVRRGNWHVKVSSYKNEQVLVVASHIISGEFIMQAFNNNNAAAEFISCIIDEDIL